MTGLKQFLLGLMLLGAVTYFGGGGTWGSFSAETANSGETIASGTLTMSDQVNATTACLSANGAATNNVNPACNAALTLTNVAPGVFGGVAQITIQNTGSIDASKLFFWASSVNATLNGGLTSGVAATTLTVTALEGAVTTGDSIVLSYGTHTQTFLASAGASGGAASISVTSQLANFSYPIGTTVTDTSSNANVNNTNCYDVKTTSPGTVGATKGTDLNFNPATGNPFCAATLIFVQETTGGFNYCWLGKGSSPEAANGACTAPITVNISTLLSTGGAITSLPVTALNGNVASGDSIVVTSGTHTQTFTATAAAFFGATSITVTSATPNFAYPITSTVVDTTSQGTLNSDSTDTITNFNTAHGSVGRIQLYPVTANGTVDTLASVQLSHFNTGTFSRVFRVGLYVPAPAGTNQNQLQGLSSTFGITWHLDQ
jgi:hypothetical protein